MFPSCAISLAQLIEMKLHLTGFLLTVALIKHETWVVIFRYSVVVPFP